MDPVTLATVTAALTLLGTECTKGIASQAGKDLWARAKGLLGWSNEPVPQELPKVIATQLGTNHALLAQVTKLLQESQVDNSSVQMVGSLVGTLTAQKAVIAQKIEGGITM